MSFLVEGIDVPLLTQEIADEKRGSLSEIHPQNMQNRLMRDEDGFPLSNTSAVGGRRQLYTVITTSVITCFTTTFLINCFWAFFHRKDMFKKSPTTPFIFDEFHSTNSSRVTGCGNTVSEAIALNCSFDELSDLWLPQKCSRKYTDDYSRTNNGGPFLYWIDPKGSQLVTDRSQYAGGAVYYSTTRDHLRHCEYNLYRFADSLMTGELVGHSKPFRPHIHHRAQILGKFANLAPALDNIDVDTKSEFGYC